MAKVYNWKISAIEVDKNKTVGETDLTDVVTNVHWIYSVTENDETTDMYGVEAFSDVVEDSFTEFADLTAADVEGWLEDVLDVDNMKANLNAQLELKVNPVSEIKTAPWL